jgi:hypothetical protein
LEADEPAANRPQLLRLGLLDDAAAARRVQDPTLAEPEGDVGRRLAPVGDQVAVAGSIDALAGLLLRAGVARNEAA